jgi:RNA:NAD 2'-phosphotransferase (TPT1/KptA family)
MNPLLHDKPSEICAEDGHVLIDGPGGIVVALTPEAAAETSDRLLHAAAEAKGQSLMQAMPQA